MAQETPYSTALMVESIAYTQGLNTGECHEIQFKSSDPSIVFWRAKMDFIEVQMGEYNGPMCLMKEPMMSNSIPSMMILYI